MSIKKFAVVQHLPGKAPAGPPRGVFFPGMGVTPVVGALCFVIKGGPSMLSFFGEGIQLMQG